jgi:outer membrane protein with glycine zipper
MAMMGLAVSVAACSTAGQGSGGLGETASQTVKDHPQTAVGAGVGAAGGAVVGGLAGGTKGAVIGGLLGARAGGVVGNHVERQEAVLPQSTTGSTPASTPGATTGVYRPRPLRESIRMVPPWCGSTRSKRSRHSCDRAEP